jgi:hypothetical protein
MSARVHSEQDLPSQAREGRVHAVTVSTLKPNDPGLANNNDEWHQARLADARHLALLAQTDFCYDDFEIEGGAL